MGFPCIKDDQSHYEKLAAKRVASPSFAEGFVTWQVCLRQGKTAKNLIKYKILLNMKYRYRIFS